jgi:hypothetical protein
VRGGCPGRGGIPCGQGGGSRGDRGGRGGGRIHPPHRGVGGRDVVEDVDFAALPEGAGAGDVVDDVRGVEGGFDGPVGGAGLPGEEVVGDLLQRQPVVGGGKVGGVASVRDPWVGVLEELAPVGAAVEIGVGVRISGGGVPEVSRFERVAHSVAVGVDVAEVEGDELAAVGEGVGAGVADAGGVAEGEVDGGAEGDGVGIEHRGEVFGFDAEDVAVAGGGAVAHAVGGEDRAVRGAADFHPHVGAGGGDEGAVEGDGAVEDGIGFGDSRVGGFRAGGERGQGREEASGTAEGVHGGGGDRVQRPL